MTEREMIKQAVLDRIADNWTPSQMRDLSANLLRLADSIDQQWEAPSSGSVFRWPSKLRQIECNAVNLGMKAQLIYQKRLKRREFIPQDVLAEPAWDMLLELFMQFAGGAKVSTTSLCIASNTPVTTALRYIGILEELGLVMRSPSQYDKRVTFISLTDKGVLAVGSYLERY